MPDTEKKIEWVPYANGNADALFTFDVQQANTDRYNDIAQKFNAKIPQLAVQCVNCGRVHRFTNLLTDCPVCSRTSYAFRGKTSRLTIFCTECDSPVLESVKCQCGTSNPINGLTLRKEKPRCFIATATYGSSFAPEVMAFRQFRDDHLLRSKLGAAIVRFYYFASPPIATIVENHRLVRSFMRFLLQSVLRLIKH